MIKTICMKKKTKEKENKHKNMIMTVNDETKKTHKKLCKKEKQHLMNTDELLTN